MSIELKNSSNVAYLRNPEFRGDYVGRPADEDPNWDENGHSKELLPGNTTIFGWIEPENRFLPKGQLKEPIRATATGKKSQRTKWNTYICEEDGIVFYKRAKTIPTGTLVSAHSRNVTKDKDNGHR
jgi:hypothetical protein